MIPLHDLTTLLLQEIIPFNSFLVKTLLMVARFAYHTLNFLRLTRNCMFFLAVCKSVESMYSRFDAGILLSYLYATIQSMYPYALIMYFLLRGSGSFVHFLMTIVKS